MLYQIPEYFDNRPLQHRSFTEMWCLRWGVGCRVNHSGWILARVFLKLLVWLRPWLEPSRRVTFRFGKIFWFETFSILLVDCVSCVQEVHIYGFEGIEVFLLVFVKLAHHFRAWNDVFCIIISSCFKASSQQNINIKILLFCTEELKPTSKPICKTFFAGMEVTFPTMSRQKAKDSELYAFSLPYYATSNAHLLLCCG